MPQPVKLSDELMNDAKIHAKSMHRTPPKQIEHWARIGKLAEENPELPLGFVIDMLVGIEEANAGDVTEYKFG